MAMEDGAESCGSRAADTRSFSSSAKQRQRVEVFNEVLARLHHMNHEEATLPDFEAQLWTHFSRLPPRYALDVNVERAEDVLIHKRLLHLAADPANRPVFDVRLVQVVYIWICYLTIPATSNGNAMDSSHLDSSMKEDAQSCSNHSSRQGLHPPPTFGSSQNLEALVLPANRSDADDGDSVVNSTSQLLRPMHEITFSTVDKPKLLSQLTSLLSEVGLNIQEAHAFSTVDGFSVDVFVVDGWPDEETELLRDTLEKEILKTKEQAWKQLSLPTTSEHGQTVSVSTTDCVRIPTDGTDVWEINANLLKFENKVASGSFGDLFKGMYCSQEVAIKVLKPELVNLDMLREFSQEVFILRKIRHKNVVQFIGACTQPPNFCIVTEFMSKGSLYSLLHKQRGAFKLPTLLKVAIDVSKGMNYLHQNNIIHRDLKTANLLMDENAAQSGVMTAETGTYRWMAPEVIEHEPYDHKADIFSFGVVLWELLTGELPYSYLTPLQAAVGVVQQGLRPTIPKHTHPGVAELLVSCWQQDPTLRPNFSEILEKLQRIAKEVGDDGADRQKDKSPGGLFSALRRGHR
ncbi:hypothetical protein RJ639_039695 [Escallonia herrerae]|uniref:non-specific serine/threonine protein kinase n=1 Tax=Escallonia herrerae TaxID=1293975 RepID=A0AA88WNS5_9ASTE|nr:hypothetical protein RJ639_039695 [Escallonia herrerae]